MATCFLSEEDYGELLVTLYEVSDDLNTVTHKARHTVAAIDKSGWRFTQCYITAGNFVGNNNSNSAGWDIAVSYLHRDGHFRTTLVDLAVIAYDGDGDSLYLGAPIHSTLRNLARVPYVIQKPPKHIDYLDGEIANVSRSPDFYVELRDESGETFCNQTSKESDWTIGGSLFVTASQTVGADAVLCKAEATVEGTVPERNPLGDRPRSKAVRPAPKPSFAICAAARPVHAPVAALSIEAGPGPA